MSGELTRHADTRTMARRTVARMRADLTRLAGYIKVLAITEDVPRQVYQSVAELERWTRMLVRKGRPPRP